MWDCCGMMWRCGRCGCRNVFKFEKQYRKYTDDYCNNNLSGSAKVVRVKVRIIR
jgi:uncharacterized C2H2 Zn-finger protein